MTDTMTAAEFREQHKGYETERDLQRAACQWMDAKGMAYFAVPNGQMRSGQAMEPGLQSGVPDLCVPIPTGTYGSLYIELKQPGKYTRKEQREWLSRLVDLGHACAVCRSLDDVIHLVSEYLGDTLDPTDLWPEQR